MQELMRDGIEQGRQEMGLKTPWSMMDYSAKEE
jgi:hypothetical protein